MRSADAKDRLLGMLSASAVDVRQRDVYELWEVFKSFAAITAEDARDDLGPEILYEFGPFGWTKINGYPQYKLRFVRQYSLVEPTDDDIFFEQVCCDFWFRPTEELRACSTTSLWSFDFGDAATFCTAVEGHQDFRDVPKLYRPRRLLIYHSRIGS